MWESSKPRWHGIARADVFATSGLPAICEINSDTPSGEAEATILNLATLRSGLVDPNAALEIRFVDHVFELGRAVVRSGRPLTIGIVYPTELTEDLSMIELYRQWFDARGCSVVLGSPYNLHEIDGRAALFDRPCDVFIRHYKTDWWGERLRVWDNEEAFADPEPLTEKLEILLDAEARGACAIVNPFGAVLTQNKLSMAFMWEEIARFSPAGQEAIRRHVPQTYRLDRVPSERLIEKDLWVLKSDYGCEGSEVIIGRHVTAEEWTDSLKHAIPPRWVAQRYFQPIVAPDQTTINYGVYLIQGRASGFFSRVHEGATDYHALAAPTFIQETST
jgi:glutathionylspermidine synthase